MKAQSILGSAVVGVGLGALLLPAAALAQTTTVSPATTPVGGTVVLTTTCNPNVGDAIFRVTGPNRDQNVRSTTAAAGGGLSAELFTAGFTLGTYTVTTTCGDGSSGGSAQFTVTPIGGAQAGAGGSGPDTGVLAAGGALAAGAVAGGAYVLIRRRRRAAVVA
ncbi:hypothetical protein GCM10023176_42160 [Micromonospora coerulea]|uniref:LPXTG cell wall anchor domain-containing protein n=1 Tax=Micromonospora coerulea TaxID=47856 RepID=A0ABP8SRZ1_9ACTN|nr:hypothetical protein [Micromonospora veneta]